MVVASVIGAYEIAGYVGAGIVAAGISQMTSPIKAGDSLVLSSPSQFSEYQLSNQASSSPLARRIKAVRKRRRRKRKRVVQSWYGRKFIKSPSFFKLPK